MSLVEYTKKTPQITEYDIIIDDVSVTFKKERNESFSQFSLRMETYIKALENGVEPNKALMLSSMECNKVKYGVSYREISQKLEQVSQSDTGAFQNEIENF